MTRKRKFLIGCLLPIALVVAAVAVIYSLWSEKKVMPVATAHSDGFEVIVLLDSPDASDQEVKSLRLTQAEELVRSTPKATFLLPKKLLPHIESQVASQAKQSPSSSYPFVDVTITHTEEGKQQIDLSYHFSKSTYHYCYEASLGSIRPLWSSYRDFRRNTIVQYE